MLIHGIWMTGYEMALLGRRLQRCGFDVFRFPYSARHPPPGETVRRLKAFIDALPYGQIHLVAHSLGGRIAWRLVQGFPELKPGRVVALGTPFVPSTVARKLAGRSWGNRLLGRGGADGLLEPLPEGRPAREFGVIAGTLPWGVGRLFCALDGPNDGTVTVAETRLPGITDHITLATTHMGMLFSRPVAAQACLFLHAGRFAREDA